MSLVNVKKEFGKDVNFWEMNQQLIYLSPFSKLYQRDKSKDKEKSSKEMWMVFFLCDPDEEKNKFYRIEYNERLKMLKDTFYPAFKEYDEVIQECLEAYPAKCLTAVERALKQEIDSMTGLVNYITSFNYDDISLDDINKLVRIRAQTPKVMENYEKLQSKFIKQKKESRLRGGRKESKRESKQLFAKVDTNEIDFD